MSSVIATNQELYHYGVLGMKWGKRKARYAEGTVRGAKYSQKYNTTVSRQNVKSAEARLNSINKINSLKSNNDRKGVKAERKRYRLDSTIQRYKDSNELSKISYDYVVNEAKLRRSQQSNRFAKMKDAQLRNKLKEYERQYSSTKKINDYGIAKAEGKKNPSYKNTEEYKKRIREGRIEVGKAAAAAYVAAMVQASVTVASGGIA